MSRKTKKEKDENNKNKLLKNVFTITDDNYDFIKNISSKSGFIWNENYYMNANKYMTCLHIHEFMPNSYPEFLSFLIDLPFTFVSLDGEEMQKEEYKKVTDKFMRVENDKINESNRFSETSESMDNLQSMGNFIRELQEKEHTSKLITLRVYVFAYTLEELQKRVNYLDDLMSDKELHGYIKLNNLKADVRAITSFSNPVRKMVSSETVSNFAQRSEINYVDKNAMLLGVTKRGNFALNIFKFKGNANRNIMAIGGMGSAKSTLLKKIVNGNLLTNLKENTFVIHMLDIHKEYVDFCHMHGIPIISVDENNNVNIMQIFYTENADNIITKNDISTQISNVVETFDNMTRYNRKQTLDKLSVLLTSCYERYLKKNLDDIKNDDWLLLSEVLDLVTKKIRNNELNNEELIDYSNIQLGLNKMCSVYGYMFNVHTNLNFDLSKSFCLDVSFLANNKDINVKAGYVTLLQSYLSKAISINRWKNENEMKRLGIDVHDLYEPIYKHMILIDETMQYATSGFIKVCTAQNKLQRKCYSLSAYVIHSTSDIENENSSDTVDISNVKELFKLAPHKFLGLMDGDSINKMYKENLIPQLNERDVLNISNFKIADDESRPYLYVNQNNEKIYFYNVATRFQLQYFGGGR